MTPDRGSRLRSWALPCAAVASLTACDAAESHDAPQSEKPAASVPAPPTIPTGASLTFLVDQTISTDRSHRGDRFTGTLAEDVVGPGGDIVLPAGTKARWVVKQAISDGGLGGGSVLAVRLEALRLNEEWVPAEGTVAATDLQLDQTAPGADTAATIAVGTAAGAILGPPRGHDSRRTPARAGTPLGTVVALSTRDGSATIPAGSRITVELRHSLVLDG